MTINGKGSTAQAQSVFCTKPDEGSATRRDQEYFIGYILYILYILYLDFANPKHRFNFINFYDI